ncbi:hypothetical protein AAMO2058_000926700 [Amorphochlora amoebiformis]
MRAVTTFLRHNSAYSVIGCTSATAGVLGVSYKRAFSTVVAEKAREALRFEHGKASLPHPDKKNGGEDAVLVDPQIELVGVADGVGGWSSRGIDAGRYARHLMVNICKAARSIFLGEQKEAAQKESQAKGFSLLMKILVSAHRETKDLGSTTVCLVRFQEETLTAVNIGDSGFVIVRDGKIAFKSPSQQHAFNFPYQIGWSGENDAPSLADTYEVPVKAGDTVIVATDGLFDNIFDFELCNVVEKGKKDDLTPDQLARSLGIFAQNRGKSTVASSPFASAAIRAGYFYSGGKLDDTTLTVTFVSERDPERVIPLGKSAHPDVSSTVLKRRSRL